MTSSSRRRIFWRVVPIRFQNVDSSSDIPDVPEWLHHGQDATTFLRPFRIHVQTCWDVKFKGRSVGVRTQSKMMSSFQGVHGKFFSVVAVVSSWLSSTRFQILGQFVPGLWHRSGFQLPPRVRAGSSTSLRVPFAFNSPGEFPTSFQNDHDSTTTSWRHGTF